MGIGSNVPFDQLQAQYLNAKAGYDAVMHGARADIRHEGHASSTLDKVLLGIGAVGSTVSAQQYLDVMNYDRQQAAAEGFDPSSLDWVPGTAQVAQPVVVPVAVPGYASPATSPMYRELNGQMMEIQRRLQTLQTSVNQWTPPQRAAGVYAEMNQLAGRQSIVQQQMTQMANGVWPNREQMRLERDQISTQLGASNQQLAQWAPYRNTPQGAAQYNAIYAQSQLQHGQIEELGHMMERHWG